MLLGSISPGISLGLNVQNNVRSYFGSRTHKENSWLSAFIYDKHFDTYREKNAHIHRIFWALVCIKAPERQHENNSRHIHPIWKPLVLFMWSGVAKGKYICFVLFIIIINGMIYRHLNIPYVFLLRRYEFSFRCRVRLCLSFVHGAMGIAVNWSISYHFIYVVIH